MSNNATITIAAPGRSWFYVAMGAVAVGIVVIGFVPGLAFSPTKRHGPPTTDILLHGLVAAMWLALFITQADVGPRQATPGFIGGLDGSEFRSPSRLSQRALPRRSHKGGGASHCGGTLT